MKHGLKLTVFLLAFSSLSAENARPPEGLLDHLEGQWVLSGTIKKSPTTHDISAEWVLNHGYLRLREVSHEKKTDGTPAYEAIIFISFDSTSNEYSCLWLDTTSNAGLSADGIAHGKPGGNSIPFIFKDTAGKVTFENTFSYDKKSDSWEWKMDNVNDDQRSPFGRVRLVKK